MEKNSLKNNSTNGENKMEDGTYRVLSGMKVTNENGTFYFSEPGNWIDENGMPIREKLHRLDGPAVEHANGTKYWFVDGELHREDGPAIEHINGDKYWFVDGKLLTEKEFNKWRKQNGKWHISRTH